MISSRWTTERPTVVAVADNGTTQRFDDAPPDVQHLKYPAAGDPELAERIADLLADAGLACDTNRACRLDFGAWGPFLLAYPSADIPLVQISVQAHLGAGHHYQLGQAIAPLRHEDVLVVGSGTWTDDLHCCDRPSPDVPEAVDAAAFRNWMDDALTCGRLCDLLTYRMKAPPAGDGGTTGQGLLPLFVALGAAGEGARSQRLHQSVNSSALHMDAYAFS